jgi:hypothetical protein
MHGRLLAGVYSLADLKEMIALEIHLRTCNGWDFEELPTLKSLLYELSQQKARPWMKTRRVSQS